MNARNWHRLLRNLFSVVPTDPGTDGIFSWLPKALRKAAHKVWLSPQVHDELDTWRWVIMSLHKRAMHFWELTPPPPIVKVPMTGVGLVQKAYFLVRRG